MAPVAPDGEPVSGDRYAPSRVPAQPAAPGRAATGEQALAPEFINLEEIDPGTVKLEEVLANERTVHFTLNPQDNNGKIAVTGLNCYEKAAYIGTELYIKCPDGKIYKGIENGQIASKIISPQVGEYSVWSFNEDRVIAGVEVTHNEYLGQKNHAVRYYQEPIPDNLYTLPQGVESPQIAEVPGGIIDVTVLGVYNTPVWIQIIDNGQVSLEGDVEAHSGSICFSAGNNCSVRPFIDQARYNVYYEIKPPNERNEVRVIIHAVPRLTAENITASIGANQTEPTDRNNPDNALCPGSNTDVGLKLANPPENQYPWDDVELGITIPGENAVFIPPVVGQQNDSFSLSGQFPSLPRWNLHRGDSSHVASIAAGVHTDPGNPDASSVGIAFAARVNGESIDLQEAIPIATANCPVTPTPSATATATATPNPTATATAAPSPTATPTPTRVRVYAPLAIRGG